MSVQYDGLYIRRCHGDDVAILQDSSSFCLLLIDLPMRQQCIVPIFSQQQAAAIVFVMTCIRPASV